MILGFFWNQKWPYLECLHKLCRYKEQTHIFVCNRLIRYWNFTDSTFIIGLSVPHSKPHYLSENLPASPIPLGGSVQWVEVMATASSYSCIILRLQTPNHKIMSNNPVIWGEIIHGGLAALHRGLRGLTCFWEPAPSGHSRKCRFRHICDSFIFQLWMLPCVASNRIKVLYNKQIICVHSRVSAAM